MGCFCVFNLVQLDCSVVQTWEKRLLSSVLVTYSERLVLSPPVKYGLNSAAAAAHGDGSRFSTTNLPAGAGGNFRNKQLLLTDVNSFLFSPLIKLKIRLRTAWISLIIPIHSQTYRKHTIHNTHTYMYTHIHTHAYFQIHIDIPKYTQVHHPNTDPLL